MLVLLLIQQMGQLLHSGVAVSQLGLLVLDQLICCNDLLGHKLLIHLQRPASCPVSHSILQSESVPSDKLHKSASVQHTAPQTVLVCVMRLCCALLQAHGEAREQAPGLNLSGPVSATVKMPPTAAM